VTVGLDDGLTRRVGVIMICIVKQSQSNEIKSLYRVNGTTVASAVTINAN